MNTISELANKLVEQYFQEVEESQNDEINSQIMGSSVLSPHITIRENRRAMLPQPTPSTNRRDTIEELTEMFKPITVEDNLPDNGQGNNSNETRTK